MKQQLVQEFIPTFHFLQRFDCLEAIDQILLKLINEDWSTESVETNKILIVTFCRSNFNIRKKLEYYDDFLNKSIKYLESNQIQPISILKGIINEQEK